MLNLVSPSLRRPQLLMDTQLPRIPHLWSTYNLPARLIQQATIYAPAPPLRLGPTPAPRPWELVPLYDHGLAHRRHEPFPSFLRRNLCPLIVRDTFIVACACSGKLVAGRHNEFYSFGMRYAQMNDIDSELYKQRREGRSSPGY